MIRCAKFLQICLNEGKRVKMKFRILIVTLVFTILSNPSFAEETTFGIGAGINDGLKIYLPINVGKLLIEPTIFISSTEDHSSSNTSIRTSTNSSESDVLKLGVGLFYIKEVSKGIVSKQTE